MVDFVLVKAAPHPVLMAHHHPRTNTLETLQTPMFRYVLLCDTKITSFVTRNQTARTRTQSERRNTSQPNVGTPDIWGVGTVFLTPCTDSISDFTPALRS